MKRYVSIAIAMHFMLISLCLAEVPGMLNYQGRVVENGQLVNSNGMAVTLTLWDESTGGNNVYQEVDSVDVVDGLYATALGDNPSGGSASLPEALNTLGTNAWLGLKFGADPELTPRERLLSSAFALTVRGIYVGSSGNVGIGTNSPAERLHVVGKFIGDGSLLTGLSGDNLGNHKATRDINMSLESITNVSSVASGTGLFQPLRLEANGVLKLLSGMTSAGITGIKFYNGPDLLAGSLQAVMATNGFWGLGTNSPAERLHVVGNERVDGNITAGIVRADSLEVDHPNVDIYLSQTGRHGAASGWDPNPSSALEGIWIENGSSESGGFYADGDVAVIWSPGDADILRVYDEDDLPNGAPVFVIAGNGNVGVGITNPASRISVAGGATCDGTTWNDVSDVNAKENFNTVDPTAILDKVVALPITTWNYKQDDDAVRHIGPMAQDFHMLFEMGNSEKTLSGVDRSGVTLAAIQGLYREFTKQSEEIQELRARLAALEERPTP